MKKYLMLISLISSLGCATKVEKLPAVVYPTTIQEAVSSSFRTEENKKRDIARHPQQTLEFFGLKSDMTVVEISPSRGWYTQILAPLLVPTGKYIAADPPSDPRGYTTPRKEWIKQYPELELKTQIVAFHPETHLDFVASESVDMILTFRNIHNWKTDKNKEDAFKAFHKALKKGGILGVVEHRANEKGKVDPKSGYLKESDVVKIAKKAGFKLEAKSEVNANPKDTKNYKDGVWTLPPTLRLGDLDRDKYTEIGESDRMTLKFVKQ